MSRYRDPNGHINHRGHGEEGEPVKLGDVLGTGDGKKQRGAEENPERGGGVEPGESHPGGG